MTKHEQIYENFKNKFQQYAHHVYKWTIVGPDSISIRFYQGGDFVYTYRGPFDWRFETTKSYYSHRIEKGGRRMNARLHDNI